MDSHLRYIYYVLPEKTAFVEMHSTRRPNLGTVCQVPVEYQEWSGPTVEPYTRMGVRNLMGADISVFPKRREGWIARIGPRSMVLVR